MVGFDLVVLATHGFMTLFHKWKERKKTAVFRPPQLCALHAPIRVRPMASKRFDWQSGALVEPTSTSAPGFRPPLRYASSAFASAQCPAQEHGGVQFPHTGKWDSLPEIASVLSSDCRKIPFKDAALCIGH